jgi:hypothetical protein
MAMLIRTLLERLALTKIYIQPLYLYFSDISHTRNPNCQALNPRQH